MNETWTNNTWHLVNACEIDCPHWKVQIVSENARVGGWEDVMCVCVRRHLSLYVVSVGTLPEKKEAGFRGWRGSPSSAVRKFCFSLHQPICPHICSASQTPLCFLELLCQSVTQSFSPFTPKVWIFKWVCMIKGVITPWTDRSRVLRKIYRFQSCIHLTWSAFEYCYNNLWRDWPARQKRVERWQSGGIPALLAG